MLQFFMDKTELQSSHQYLSLLLKMVTPSKPSSLMIKSPSNQIWDQFQHSRTAYTHAPTSHQQVLCTHTHSAITKYNIGATWTHYNIDPNDTHPIIDSMTNLIPPWRAYCPDHNSELLHYPAAVPNVYIDHNLFFTSFTQPWETKNQANFMKHFPPLPSKATTCDLLPFYKTIVPHCQGYYVFVPPLSTLHSGLIMGTWFTDLTDGIKSECL